MTIIINHFKYYGRRRGLERGRGHAQEIGRESCSGGMSTKGEDAPSGSSSSSSSGTATTTATSSNNIHSNMADPKEEQETTTDNAEDTNHDPHFEPIVSLPEQEVKTLEEDEEELFKMRAKLYRFASENDPPEWKERGTGDVKLLKHKEKGTIRLLMRRDRTLKICANHHVLPSMELKPNAGSDRAWVWNTLADFADESPKPELLAIRFLNAENAQKFKVKFDECKEEARKSENGAGETADKVAEKLEELSVKEGTTEEKKEEEKREKAEEKN